MGSAVLSCAKRMQQKEQRSCRKFQVAAATRSVLRAVQREASRCVSVLRIIPTCVLAHSMLATLHVIHFPAGRTAA